MGSIIIPGEVMRITIEWIANKSQIADRRKFYVKIFRIVNDFLLQMNPNNFKRKRGIRLLRKWFDSLKLLTYSQLVPSNYSVFFSFLEDEGEWIIKIVICGHSTQSF